MKFLPLAALLSLTTIAHADPIFVSGLNPDALALSPGSGGTLNVTSATGFAGTGTYQSDSGTAAFGPMSFMTQVPSGTGFPITPPAPESFLYQSAGSLGNVSMTIGWTQLNNLAEVELVGDALVTAADGQFLTEYPVGSTATVEAFFPTSFCTPLVEGGDGPCDISSVAQIAFFEGGNFTPDGDGPLIPHDELPEPGSSLTFLGIAMGVFLTWRHRAKMLGRRYSASAML